MKRVVIVEDVTQTRDWLQDLVAEALPEAQIETAETLSASYQLCNPPPDLALIDLRLPDGSGFDLLKHLSSKHPETVCVIMTTFGNDADVVSALSQGAQGYLLKEQDPAILIHQLRQINLGIPALSPVIARRIMAHFRDTGPLASDHDLTPRETEVLGFIARGLRNGEVARELGLTEHTVAGYIKDIYRKLGISSRAEASWHATRLGLRSVSSD